MSSVRCNWLKKVSIRGESNLKIATLTSIQTNLTSQSFNNFQRDDETCMNCGRIITTSNLIIVCTNRQIRNRLVLAIRLPLRNMNQHHQKIANAAYIFLVHFRDPVDRGFTRMGNSMHQKPSEHVKAQPATGHWNSSK